MSRNLRDSKACATLRMLLACIALGLLGVAATVTAGAAQTGVSFSVKITGMQDDEGNHLPVTHQQVDQTITVMKKRLKAMGHLKSHISQKSGNGFEIRVDGVTADKSSAIASILRKPGRLEIREVSPRSEEREAEGRILAQRVQDGEEIVPGYRVFTLKSQDEEGNEYTRPILLNRRIAISNPDVAIATLWPQQDDTVAITLNKQGTDKMIAFTTNMKPSVDRIAVVLDGDVISAPVIMSVPLGGNFIISGLHEPGEAEITANAIMHPLEFPIVIERKHAVPTNKVAK